MATSARDQFAASLELFRNEKAAIVEQRKEIGILIKQAATEIDRLTQRNRELSPQMRHLEASIESFPRSEIKQMYATSQEAQMRLFMMQNQLEQLRSRQSNLERMEQLLDGFVEMAGSLLSLEQTDAPATTKERPATSGSQPAAAQSQAAAFRSIETTIQRLSRQLQDGPAQALTDLILRAEVCDRLVAMDSAKGREELARLRGAITAALKTTRQMVYELQPPVLEETGLGAALRKYVDASRLHERMRVDVEITGLDKRLPEAVELAVFRILQEALANAAEHSGAAKVDLGLRLEQDRLMATVTDRGRGFDVTAALQEAAQAARSGLADMHSRAGLVGAELDIESSPGSGCTVRISVPV